MQFNSHVKNDEISFIACDNIKRCMDEANRLDWKLTINVDSITIENITIT